MIFNFVYYYAGKGIEDKSVENIKFHPGSKIC